MLNRFFVRCKCDRASISIILLGSLSVIFMTLQLGILFADVSLTTIRANHVADTGAVAGASALFSGSGNPCPTVEMIVIKQDAELISCVFGETDVVVEVAKKFSNHWLQSTFGSTHSKAKAGFSTV